MTRAFKLFIDGQWVDGASVHEIPGPWDGEIVGTVALGGPEHVEAGIAATVAAAPRMAALPAWRRSEILNGIVAGLNLDHHRPAGDDRGVVSGLDACEVTPAGADREGGPAGGVEQRGVGLVAREGGRAVHAVRQVPAILLAASRVSSFMTGANTNVDGGSHFQ